jgi:hypothetical protein
MAANDNQCVVTKQGGVVLKEFEIAISFLVIFSVYASTYPVLSSGSKFICQN